MRESFPLTERLQSLPPWDGRSRFGLRDITELLRILGNPQDAVPSIHMTGTNGKGTTCAIISAALAADGFRVGQTSSPHLQSFCERILIQGEPIQPAVLEEMLQKIFHLVDTAGIELSPFEIITAASFLSFSTTPVESAVVEVGLGGKLDATNVMKAPVVCGISSIGYDHTHILGDTLEAIATDKAHIFRAAVPAVVGRVSPSVRAAILVVSNRIGAPVEFLGVDFAISSRGVFTSRDGVIELPTAERGLLASYQFDNVAVAARISQHAGVSTNAIIQGVRSYRWPGRVEKFIYQNRLGQKRVILTDGAHNPQGVAGFLDYLSEFLKRFPAREVRIVLSMLDTKAWGEMLLLLKRFGEGRPEAIRWIFTTSGYRNAVSPEGLQKEFGGGEVFGSADEAFSYAVGDSDIPGDEAEDIIVVVTGSLYLLGLLRPRFTSEPFRTIS